MYSTFEVLSIQLVDIVEAYLKWIGIAWIKNYTQRGLAQLVKMANLILGRDLFSIGMQMVGFNWTNTY